MERSQGKKFKLMFNKQMYIQLKNMVNLYQSYSRTSKFHIFFDLQLANLTLLCQIQRRTIKSYFFLGDHICELDKLINSVPIKGSVCQGKVALKISSNVNYENLIEH